MRERKRIFKIKLERNFWSLKKGKWNQIQDNDEVYSKMVEISNVPIQVKRKYTYILMRRNLKNRRKVDVLRDEDFRVGYHIKYRI